MVVPFDLVENQVVVGIKICGRGPFVCLLDTAVEPSVVDLTLTRELGLRVSDDLPGEVAGQGSEVATFYPSELPDVRLGELGNGFLQHTVLTLDYPRRSSTSPPRWSHVEPSASEYAQGTFPNAGPAVCTALWRT